MGHTEKAPLLSDIFTAWKREILFEDFFCNVAKQTYFMVQFGIFAKQITRILHFCQTTKHTASDTA